MDSSVNDTVVQTNEETKEGGNNSIATDEAQKSENTVSASEEVKGSENIASAIEEPQEKKTAFSATEETKEMSLEALIDETCLGDTGDSSQVGPMEPEEKMDVDTSVLEEGESDETKQTEDVLAVEKEPTLLSEMQQNQQTVEEEIPKVDPDNVKETNLDEETMETTPPVSEALVTPPPASVPEQSEDLLQEVEQVAKSTVSSSKGKGKNGSFSLGVPGLNVSTQNLKIASDGTKMVQIHQSQITPSQLQALQSNPNIKVVFRHIPTGKSFTKPPKNLFNAHGAKRKRFEDEDGLDDSIYNFDDDFEHDSYIDPPKSKVRNLGSGNAKYARYNPNVGMKKRGPGRPRLHPNVKMLTNKSFKPALPTQIQLTDALVKLNKPGAAHTVKIHIKQVTHDMLINMELNPEYNIILTAKHEVPPEYSLEELVKEWEEKENITEKESLDKREIEERVDAEDMSLLENEVELQKSVDVEDKEAVKQQQKFKNQLKEKEEVEFLSAALLEKTSRSGRVRKPTRYSLDIARLTKRRSVPGDVEASADKNFVASPPATKHTPQKVLAESPASKIGSSTKKRGRGRPRKIKKEVVEDVIEKSIDEKNKTVISEHSTASLSVEPRVMMSTVDKLLAEKIRLQADGKTKKDEEETSTDKNKVEDDKNDTVYIPVVKEEMPDTPEEPMPDTLEEPMPDVKEKEATSNNIEEAPVNEQDGINECKESMDTSETKMNENTKKSESPSDVLVRKLDMSTVDDKTSEQKSEDDKAKYVDPTLKDFVEEEGNVDNKYRLRKLLQQCSIEEIRSVAIPKALDIISLGDFFLHKAGQMCSKNVKFAALYEQLESLYSSVEKESLRYSTLLRRANKVGGERRMEKVILMPIYNKQAAESLDITNSSIDAHIGGIHQKPTTHMIAANSFRMGCKMDKIPLRRVKLQELSDRIAGQGHKKRGIGALNNHLKMVASQEGGPSSGYVQQSYTNATKTRGSWKRGYQVRKPGYLSGGASNAHESLQQHARMQLASRYQTQPIVTREPVGVTSAIVDTPASANPLHVASQAAGLVSSANEISAPSTTIDTSMDLTSVLNSELTTTQAPEIQTQVVPTAEDGTPIVAAEDGKQLVSIGDGQYVELPEGYTLIQTDDGYIIGQPGATFVQGEDGNVYMTNSEDTTTELTDEVLTTTASNGENQSNDQLLEQLAQT